MNLRHKALSGLFWSAIEKWGSKFFSLIVFLLLARLLAPEAFGLIALASVFVALVRVLIDQGFADAIVQRQKLEAAHLDTAFWVNLGLGCAMAGLGLFAAKPIAYLLNEPELEPIIRVLSLLFVFGALSGVQTALFRRNLAFKVLAARTLVANVIGGIVGVGLALNGFGVWSLVGQHLATSGAGVIVLWTASDWRPGLRVSRAHFKDLFSFGVNVIGINILNFLNRRSDDLLIGYFLGSTALGYYTVAYRILTTLTDLLTSISVQVAFPIFSKMQQDPERMLRAFYTATKYASIIAFPVFMGLAATAPEVIPVVFGPKWAPSIPVMQILAFIGLLHSVSYFNGSLMMALGKPSWRLALGALNAATNIVAFLIAVRWGIVAVAAAYVLRGYLLAPITPWVIQKLVGLRFSTYLRQFVVPLIGSLAIVGTVLGLHALTAGTGVSQSFNLGLEIVAGAVAYIVTVSFLSPSLFQQVLHMARGHITSSV